MSDIQKFLKDMGYRISIQRKRKGYTQEQVAELADISPQLLSDTEHGKRAISSDKLFRISRALEVSADYLLSGEKTETDKLILLEKLESASEEQIKAIETICDVIMNMK